MSLSRLSHQTCDIYYHKRGESVGESVVETSLVSRSIILVMDLNPNTEYFQIQLLNEFLVSRIAENAVIME